MRKFIIIPGMLILLATAFFQEAMAGTLWTITPEAHVQQQYNDNLFRTRDNTRSDWITVIGAGLELRGVKRTQELTLGYQPSYSIYHRHDEFNTLRHNANLRFRKDLQKNLRFSFIDHFQYSEQPYDPARGYRPPDERVVIDEEHIDEEFTDESLRRGREPRTRNSARARLDYQFGPRDRAYAEYHMYHHWNKNPGEEDSVRHSPSMGVQYWFTPRYGLDVSTRYVHGWFDESENLDSWEGRARLMRNFTKFIDGFIQYRHNYVRYSGDREGYDLYEPSIGVLYRFASDGHASVGLGYYFRDEERSGTESGPILNADINKTWDWRRSAFTLRGRSGYTQAYFDTGDQGFIIYYHATALYSYAVRKNLDWNLSGQYRRNIYEDRDPDRTDNIYAAGTGLNYQLTRQVRLGLDYNYRQVDSNIRTEEYTENRITLRLNWRPQARRL